ncbi:MAG: M23 family metallopeptidase [bacterium]|nr:M23 family metallopeptidase [bacterium]
MQFFSYIFSRKTFSFINLSKEVVIALILISLPVFYPRTANAGLFSFLSGVAGGKASADIQKQDDVPNSQTMPILKAVVNSNPHPKFALNEPILISENTLLAEIGPSGTISEIEDMPNTQISLYIVRSGDTLSEIASMFDVSVNTIVWANNLGRNPIIKEGQTLVILPITGIQHTVKRGDTIKGIVGKYKGNLEEVLQYNNLTLDSVINEGDTITIPDAEPSVEVAPRKNTPKVNNSKNPVASGYYMRPISGGRRSQGIHGNNGVDLAAPIGTPIFASAGGMVIASMSNGGWNGGYGNYVIISHSNGTQTLYSHNSSNLVSVGEKVNKGQQIAKIGITGKTTGPHVHFEIRGAKNPF